MVNIEGVDQQADGGTHVANTREVGRVRIVGSENKGKGNKRLEIVAANERPRARADRNVGARRARSQERRA